MSSPVNTAFLNLIQIDRQSATALYLQLTQQLINAIQRGFLVAGNKLPGTRFLAKELQLNRNTLVAVYAELEAQGWIEILPNKGAFVLTHFQNPIVERPYKSSIAIEKYPAATGYTFSNSIILDYTAPEYTTDYFFTDGTADLRLNRFKQLSYQYSASMNRKSTIRNLSKYTDYGNIFFKEQLSNFLNQTRGIHISTENLLINRSSEMNMYLLSRVLINSGDIVVVADLSNATINMTFLQVGAKIITIPVDEHGIQVDVLRSYLKRYKIRIVYITPHHHYPTTVTLSAIRRIELLQLATTYGFIIIEDDYDYDFHYDKSAVLPMVSADVNGMVIYTGTFGKSLAPSFQTSFIVAPKNLVIALYKYLGIVDRQGDIIMEQALGEMIEEGNMHRHLKKSIQIYRERRDHFCAQLAHDFPIEITFKKPHGGLATWVTFNKSISLNKLALVAINKNLTIPRNILFQNKNITAMRIGFGHMNEDEITTAMAILKESITEVNK